MHRARSRGKEGASGERQGPRVPVAAATAAESGAWDALCWLLRKHRLKRLGTDVIDLYCMHRRDLRVPIVETVEAMAGLVQQGKVKHLGLSEVTAQELAEARSVHLIAAVHSEWFIWSRA